MRMSLRRPYPAHRCLLQEGREPRGRPPLYTLYYNFGRVHQTLRVTPAMEAGVSDHVWSLAEIVALLDGR